MIQEQTLSKIITEHDASLITLNSLTADYFSDYKAEFMYIQNHLSKYGAVPDAETFLNTFPEFELIKVTEPNSYLIEELFKDYKTRSMAAAFNKVRTLLMDGKTEEAMSVYNKSYETLSSAGVSMQSTDIVQDTSRYDDYIERTRDFSKYYTSTGFKELDEIIGGWDREEELAVVIARLGQGKSWVVLKMAAAAAMQGLTVGLYSGEMGVRQVGYRFDTLVGHINNGCLTHGNESVQSEYKKFLDDLSNRCPGKLKVLTPQMINGLASVSTLGAFIEKEKLDILFIDQYSLLEDIKQGKTDREKAANISMDLKVLQTIKRIPIIAVSQMNRSKPEDNSDTIDSAQVSTSDRIGQDATCIIGISRDKKDPSLMKLQIVKSRYSGAGQKLSYITDLNKGTWLYIPEKEKESTTSTNSDMPSEEEMQEYAARYAVEGEDQF